MKFVLGLLLGTSFSAIAVYGLMESRFSKKLFEEKVEIGSFHVDVLNSTVEQSLRTNETILDILLAGKACKATHLIALEIENQVMYLRNNPDNIQNNEHQKILEKATPYVPKRPKLECEISGL